MLLDLATTTGALTITAPPGGTYFISDTAETNGPSVLRALVRNTGPSPAAIAMTVRVIVLAP